MSKFVEGRFLSWLSKRLLLLSSPRLGLRFSLGGDDGFYFEEHVLKVNSAVVVEIFSESGSAMAKVEVDRKESVRMSHDSAQIRTILIFSSPVRFSSPRGL